MRHRTRQGHITYRSTGMGGQSGIDEIFCSIDKKKKNENKNKN